MWITEPEKVFKATFVANNKVVAVVEFAAGATSIEEPEVPAREGFTGAWAAYTVENKNFTVRAIYTLIPAQTETGTDAVTETATAPVTDTATEAVTTAESGQSRLTHRWTLPVRPGPRPARPAEAVPLLWAADWR